MAEVDLATALANLVTEVGTQFKADRTKIGDLASLPTTAKSSLVAAITELEASISGAGAVINDAAASSSAVYSSQKVTDLLTALKAEILGEDIDAALDTLKEFQTAIGDDPTFAATTATALGNRVRFDAAQALTTPQKTQVLANIGAVSAADIGDPTTDLVALLTAALA